MPALPCCDQLKPIGRFIPLNPRDGAEWAFPEKAPTRRGGRPLQFHQDFFGAGGLTSSGPGALGLSGSM